MPKNKHFVTPFGCEGGCTNKRLLRTNGRLKNLGPVGYRKGEYLT